MRRKGLIRRTLVPAFVFQSVVIAGGYGTGRELAEFFLTQGPVGGLLAMGVSTLIWSGVCVVTYELARVEKSYDYRTFLRGLLGPGWILYEIAYLIFMVLILAVIAAAAGTILEETFGLPYWVGVVGIMAAVGLLVFRDSSFIENAMAGWSVVLYVAYLILFFWSFHRFGDQILSNFRTVGPKPVEGGWALAGVRYAAYNIALVPPLLFAARRLESRRETALAGLLTGPIAMVPGCLFFLAMVGQYPGILERAVPANLLLELLGSRGFQVMFQVVLFGTLVETGTGLIHGLNERIAHRFGEQNRSMPNSLRAAIGIGALGTGTGLAGVGIVSLIADGYGTLTWVFLFVYVVPVLTLGLWRISRWHDDSRESG